MNITDHNPRGATRANTTFPGPRATAIALIFAPLLLLAGSALLIGIYLPNAQHSLSAMVEHRTRAFVAFNLAITGIVVASIAVTGLAAAIARTHPRLGRWGGVLALVGLFGPAYFLGTDHMGMQLATIDQRDAAITVIEAANKTFTMANLTVPAILSGWVVLAIGAWRAGILGRFRATALGLTALAPAGLATGLIPIAVVAWLGMAVALVPLGLSWLNKEHQDSLTTSGS